MTIDCALILAFLAFAIGFSCGVRHAGRAKMPNATMCRENSDRSPNADISDGGKGT